MLFQIAVSGAIAVDPGLLGGLEPLQSLLWQFHSHKRACLVGEGRQAVLGRVSLLRLDVDL